MPHKIPPLVKGGEGGLKISTYSSRDTSDNPESSPLTPSEHLKIIGKVITKQERHLLNIDDNGVEANMPDNQWLDA